MATFYCSFNTTAWNQWLEVVGTRGRITCDDFVIPWNGTPFNFPKNKVYDDKASFTLHRNISMLENMQGLSESVVVPPCVQEVEMIRTFSDIVRTKELDVRWPRLALYNQKIISALYEAACTGNIVTLSQRQE
jgi:predicted dehydrogenase